MKIETADLNEASPSASAAPGESVTGLECRIGRATVMVPVEHVAQIAELEISPLPLTRRWVSGMGIHANRLVIAVGLVQEKAADVSSAGHLTKGVVLNVPGSAVDWALEVHEVRVLVKATVLSRARPGQKAGLPDVAETTSPGHQGSEETRRDLLPPWIARARTADGRTVGWIDVPAMLAELRSTARAFA